MKPRSKNSQRGISLPGLIFLLAIVGCIFVLGMKVVPTFTEYRSIKEAIKTVKANNNTVVTIKAAFDKQATVGYIESITSKDLDITKNKENEYDISFAYQKKIELLGPVSLLIEYEGTTANKIQQKPAGP